MKYIPSPEQHRRREVNFTHHPPQDDQVDRYKLLRATLKAVSKKLDELCPESRELSLAQTKLEEVVMWANAAIARNEPVPNALVEGRQGPKDPPKPADKREQA